MARIHIPVILLFLIFMSATGSFAQKISGQWIGGFTSSDDPAQSKTDYVLELEVNGTLVTGYSYTYFSISGKRYYVVCKLKGNYEKGSKSLSVNEVETIKTNTPRDFQNCHQSHSLTYFKKNDKETLIGKWKPVEKGSNCGKGETELERKIIQGLNTTQTDAAKSTKEPVKTTVTAPNIKKVSPKSTETKSKTESAKTQRGITKSSSEEPKLTVNKREYKIIKTIEVQDPQIKVELYDYGQIDGDTVSLFINEKNIVKNKMLTAKPVTVTLDFNDNKEFYDLIVYAENLGNIPPNTALMVVTTSKGRQEINITSTEQTSSAVRFVIKR